MLQSLYHWESRILYSLPPGLIPGGKRAEAH
jgi:hypothetical protein